MIKTDMPTGGVKHRKTYMPLNIQFFAPAGGTPAADPGAAQTPEPQTEPQTDPANNQQPPQTDPAQQPPVNTPVPEKTFTQAQVTAMMTREKNEGKQSILRKLGLKNDEEGNKTLEALGQFINMNKQPPAATAQTAVETSVLERMVKAEVRSYLVSAGVRPDYTDDAALLIMSGLDVASTETEAVEAAVREFKTKRPLYFSQTPAPAGTVPAGTGSNPPSGAAATGTPPTPADPKADAKKIVDMIVNRKATQYGAAKTK